MEAAVTQPVLVYNRIAQNQRKTLILVAVAVLSILPFVAALSYGFSAWFVAQFDRHHTTAANEIRMERSLAGVPDEYRAEVLEQVHRERLAHDREAAEDRAVRTRVTAIVACGLLGVLGLLFWGIASSPVSRVLAMSGARPSGSAEAEARRLLENLAIGAGLPVPKLYVIDSVSPNAFAAGMNPGNSVVAVTTGLLQLLDRRELEGVLAHELSHIGNHDTRLNTIVASIALFLRLPYLLRRRGIREQQQTAIGGIPAVARNRGYRLMLSPLYIYVFFIAPILAALIRSAISRSREFQADADAALLTRYPEGLLRALAKIGGAGSVVAAANPAVSHLYFADPSTGLTNGLLSGNLFATHPPIEKRVKRLAEFNGGISGSDLTEAVHAGQDFAREHPPVESTGLLDSVAQDELSILTVGNPMGSVHRVLDRTPVPIYDRADLRSAMVGRVLPGALIVVFDDPGAFRQVNTADQTFGYMARSVKLQAIDLLPAELYDPATRTAAEKALPPLDAEPVDRPRPAPVTGNPVTGKQIVIAVAFGLVIFAGLFAALMHFGSR